MLRLRPQALHLGKLSPALTAHLLSALPPLSKMFSLTLRSTLLLAAGAASFVAAAPQSVPITGTHTGQGNLTLTLCMIFANKFVATWYDSQGIGACGVAETESEFVVAIGHNLFDNYP